MSDEPERVFSQGGVIIEPRRRRIADHSLQSALSLKSWSRQGVITIDRTLFRQCQLSREPKAAPIHQDDDDSDISIDTTSKATTGAATTPVTTTNNTSDGDNEPIPLDD